MNFKPNTLLVAFLNWRYRRISHRNFVLLVSVLVGIVSGVAAVLLKSLAHTLAHWVSQPFDFRFQNYLYLVTPLVGILLTVAYVKYFNRNKLGHGLRNIIDNIHRKASVIEKDKMYSHMVTSAFTVGLGGSAGLEAPIVTTGSAIGSNLGYLFRLGHRVRTLLIGCGAAGAISAIFNAPIGGVIFAAEVLLPEISVSLFIPLLLSSLSGTLTAKLLMGQEIMLFHTLDRNFMMAQLPWYILLGAVCGLLAVYFLRFTHAVEEWFQGFASRWKRALIGGTLLGLLIFLFPVLYGEGYEAIRLLLNGNEGAMLNNSLVYEQGHLPYVWAGFVLAALLLKALACSLTIGSGGNGGIFAPSMFMGALTGYLLAWTANWLNWVDMPKDQFALAGMGGLLSGVLQAPLTGIFLIADISRGYDMIVPLMAVSSISYVTVRYFERHGIYTRQLAREGILAQDPGHAALNRMKIHRLVDRDLPVLSPDMGLDAVRQLLMKSRKNIFPVLENKQLIGILLMDDIRGPLLGGVESDEFTVRRYMQNPPARIQWSMPLPQVLQTFEKTGAWYLPVFRDGHYVGFISKSKLISAWRILLKRKEQEV